MTNKRKFVFFSFRADRNQNIQSISLYVIISFVVNGLIFESILFSETKTLMLFAEAGHNPGNGDNHANEQTKTETQEA